jgi:biotin synthase
MAGANLLFPEVGSSPRDGRADTGQGRGQAIARCRNLHWEMGWDPDRVSNCFRSKMEDEEKQSRRLGVP